jgi:hypothetical protein
VTLAWASAIKSDLPTSWKFGTHVSARALERVTP